MAGVDLLDGTPIYDIKPYIPLTDCHPEASEGYTRETKIHELKVEFPEELLNQYPEEKRPEVLGILSQDTRPTYFQDPERVYGCLLYTSPWTYRRNCGEDGEYPGASDQH